MAGCKVDLTTLQGKLEVGTLVGEIPVKFSFTGKVLSASFGLQLGTKEIEACYAPGVGGCIEIKIGAESKWIEKTAAEIR